MAEYEYHIKIPPDKVAGFHQWCKDQSLTAQWGSATLLSSRHYSFSHYVDLAASPRTPVFRFRDKNLAVLAKLSAG